MKIRIEYWYQAEEGGQIVRMTSTHAVKNNDFCETLIGILKHMIKENYQVERIEQIK